jgi:uncharacterized protein
MQNPKKESFVFEITTTALCDLDCTYCFEGKKTDGKKLNQNTETIFKNIETLCSTDYFKSKFNNIIITFWGGEPSLNYKFINDIINHFGKKVIGGIDFDFMMYSNGYNLSNLENILEFIKQEDLEHKFHIQVSYDGKVINDKFRVTNNKQVTSNQVIKNFFNIGKKYNLAALDLKATLPLSELYTMYDNWMEFRNFYIFIKNDPIFKNKNISTQYAPTLDYINTISLYPQAEQERIYNDFKEVINKIAKEEYFFYREYNHHLLSWFGSKDKRSHCQAGAKLINLNIDGTINYCHGSLYIKDKPDLSVKDLIFTEILEDDKINDIILFIESFNSAVNNPKYESEMCQECEATWCAVCPASLYSLNKYKTNNNKVEDNLYNYSSEFLNCKFYKAFGQIDRSLQKILKEH